MERFKEIGTLIHGKAVLSSPFSEELVSPVTNEQLVVVRVSVPQNVNIAIDSAQQAFEQWKETDRAERVRVLIKTADLVAECADELAETMTLEMGKTVTDAKAEVAYTEGYFRWFAQLLEGPQSFNVRSSKPDKSISLTYEPVGVCGLITPWNFPLAIPGRKIAAAIAAGCTVVLKPAHECSLSAWKLAYLMKQAGLPDGCLNLVFGQGESIGKLLLHSSKVRKVSFTGSTEVGKKLYRQAADTVKKLTLELGGHAPLIVCSDADMDVAIQGSIDAKLRNSGQTCIAPNRIFIEDSIFDDFVEGLIEKIKHLKVGDPLNPETNLTNILHPSSAKKVEQHIVDAIDRGARFLYNGKHVYEPAILDSISRDSLIYQDETFGPVFPLYRFKNDQEVVRMANDTPYGLAAYVFTGLDERGEAITKGLEYGVIGLNDGLPSAPEISFGGVKASGFGREGGPEGLRDYQVSKSVSVNTNSWK